MYPNSDRPATQADDGPTIDGRAPCPSSRLHPADSAGPYVTAPHSKRYVRCRRHEQAMLPTSIRPGWLVSNGQFREPWRNRSKPAPPERTLSDFRRPADQITLSKIAIFGGGRLFAIQNTSHLGPRRWREAIATVADQVFTIGPGSRECLVMLRTTHTGYQPRGPHP